ncbi:MAG: serine hydrolase [Spirochaetaceae bacterium]|nr:serine hydrolase [Spirochaetaceae bacterium]
MNSVSKLAAALAAAACLAVAGCAGLKGAGHEIVAVDANDSQLLRRDIPENHGFDSAKLAAGIEEIRRSGLRAHSLVIVRDGAILSEAYFEPYDGTIYHDQASVTKSFMTTLVGIAIDRGRLTLDAPLVSFFPGREIADRDERKERVTVRHLLSCSSGLSGDPRDAERTAAEMRASPDWVQFALDRPCIAEPGERFAYSNLDMHLLSAILQEATGRTALEYARTELFAPLGIQDVHWDSDPQGYTRGWGDLSLKPVDAAKLGQLFLDRGAWGTARIVSADWVARATATQARTESWRKEDYGFGWWVSRKGAIPTFLADGRGGQRILVAPGLDLIIAMTGGGFEIDDAMESILPALSWTRKKLRPNSTALASLRAAERSRRDEPAAQAAPEAPAIASSVSGRIYDFERNAIGVRSVAMDFRPGREAELRLEMQDESAPRVSMIGLDGEYRASCAGRPVLARGSWTDDGAFRFEYNEGPGLNPYEIWMRFAPGGLRFELSLIGSTERLAAEGLERVAHAPR